MLYNLSESKKYMQTAGKITIATALFSLAVFVFAFLFNAGTTELNKVEAQDSATTSLTVLNTPPVWVASTTELIESSVTSPTNSGDTISWVAVANDPNQPNYYLLICESSDTPSSTDGGAPVCNGGVQWGVSAPTPVNTQAIVSTTTTELSPFSSSNNWYSWICDDDADNARCNANFSTGTNATNSSPFVVNFRPVFTSIANDSPKNPGETVTFSATSTDPDGNDMTLIVCSTSGYSTTTNSCTGSTLATTTVPTTPDPQALYALASIVQDTTYPGYVFLVDEFGHEAAGGQQGVNSPFVVANVAPTVSNITINGGLDINLVANTETTDIDLTFTTSDANSCRVAISDDLEITDYVLSVFRSGVGTTSCDGTDDLEYNANNCYPKAVATSTWNLNCTASSTTCSSGGADDSMDWSCTFPLWFIADATDAGSVYELEDWRAGVAGIDDDSATGVLTMSVSGVEVGSLTALDLLTAAIPYGQLEPGFDTGAFNATTTVLNVGNTGLDQLLEGEAMCGTFSATTTCPTSASSTIPESQQQFSASTFSYGAGTALSSSTAQELELDIAAPTSTTTPSNGVTYWGIGVPSDITLAGSYTGLNTFMAQVAELVDW